MTSKPFSSRFQRILAALALALSATTTLLPSASAAGIGFRGVPQADGVVGWNRSTAGGPEAQRTGHELTWLRGVFPVAVFADHHLAWPGFDRITAGSTASLRTTGAIDGFPVVSGWLAQRPAGSLRRLSIRLDRMDLGADRQGTDWTYDPTNHVELRRYRRGSLSLLWGEETIATAANVPLDLTINYGNLADVVDDTASASISPFRFVRTGGALSPEAAGMVDAFLRDCANSPLRLSVGQVIRRDPFARNGRSGFRYELADVVLEKLAPDLFVDVVGSPATEGSPVSWTLRLSRASAFPVSVRVETRNGSATVRTDYQPLAQLVQFAPGQRQVTLSTTTAEDALDEADETVLLNLSSPVDVALRTNDAPATILDNDGPQVRIDNTTVVEGGSWPARTQGNTPVLSRVWLSAPSPQDIRVTVATRNGTAVAPLNWGSQDFIPATNVVVIPAGQVQAFATNQVFGDWEDERDEQFGLFLTNVVNATIGGDGTARVVITDDDGPGIYLVGGGAWEGPGGYGIQTVSNIVFCASLTHPSVQDVEFAFGVVGGTARLGSDYLRPTTGNALPDRAGQPTRYLYRIPAGQTQVFIGIPVVDDAEAEPVETVRGEISQVVNAFLFVPSEVPGPNPNPQYVAAHAVTIAITDQDSYRVAVGNVTVRETGGTQRIQVPVSIPQTNAFPMWIQFRSVAGTALEDGFDGNRQVARDFTPVLGSLTLQPGQTNGVIEVAVHGDDQAQGDRAFRMEITRADFGVAGQSGLVTILDDEAPAPEARRADRQTARSLGWARTGDGSLELQVPVGKSGGRIEFSPDLKAWTPWVPADPYRPIRVELGTAPSAGFFRVVQD